MSDEKKPYIDSDGTLVIPFECSNHEFKYWKAEGKKLLEILDEIEAPEEIRAKYDFALTSGTGKEDES